MLITWPDGLEHGPDGPCRQIPQKHTWAGQVFCTKDGTCRRRHYNPINADWAWEELPLPMSENEYGRVGYVIDHWMSVERCIATAWLHRSPECSGTVVDDLIELVGCDDETQKEEVPPGAPHASTLAWSLSERPQKAMPIEGETFHRLKWRCGIVPCDPRYKLSSHGRLANPDGKITSGFYWEGDRYAAVRGAGLVPLLTAANLRRDIPRIPPAIQLALHELMAGGSVEDVATTNGVQLGTAWSYLARAAPHAPKDELRRRVKRLVSRDLWKLLQSMREEPVLGESLTELMQVVRTRLSDRGEFKQSDFPFEELRLARLATVAP